MKPSAKPSASSGRQAKRRLGAPDYLVWRLRSGKPRQYVGRLPFKPPPGYLQKRYGQGGYLVEVYGDRSYTLLC